MSPWSPPSPLLLRRPLRTVDCLGSDSVLMFTTAGPTCLTMAEKPLERVTGLGSTSGRASLESTPFCPALTLPVIMEPARTPMERAARMPKVVESRPLRRLVHRLRPKFFIDCMDWFLPQSRVEIEPRADTPVMRKVRRLPFKSYQFAALIDAKFRERSRRGYHPWFMHRLGVGVRSRGGRLAGVRPEGCRQESGLLPA